MNIHWLFTNIFFIISMMNFFAAIWALKDGEKLSFIFSFATGICMLTLSRNVFDRTLLYMVPMLILTIVGLIVLAKEESNKNILEKEDN